MTDIDFPFEDNLLDLFESFPECCFDSSLTTESCSGCGSDGETSTSSESVTSSLQQNCYAHSDKVHSQIPHFPEIHPRDEWNGHSQQVDLNRLQLPEKSSTLLIHSTASHDSKRVKREERLIKNRESANKSRLKRKNEKAEMEEAIADLQRRVKELELENCALLADNKSLNSQNIFLRSLLSDREKELVKSKEHSFRGAVSGMSVMCLVCACSFFNDWAPSALQLQSLYKPHRTPGRVLLSVDEYPTVSQTTYFESVVESNPRAMFHVCLLVLAALCYYFYVSRNKKRCVLP